MIAWIIKLLRWRSAPATLSDQAWLSQQAQYYAAIMLQRRKKDV